jgi:glycosyltransferase involved in cell wall biosynthesis
LRLAIYCDFPYRRHAGKIYAEQSFILFLLGMRDFVQELVVVGRLDPQTSPWHFPLPDSIGYDPLPYYRALSNPLAALWTTAASARRFWATLRSVDTVWLFGPNPLALVFALLAKVRRRRVVLGVRQDYPAYVAKRHPERPLLRAAGWLLDFAFRSLARICDVVVVGPELARHYRHARRLHVMSVTLVADGEVIADASQAAHSRGEELRILSVGRLDREKNPLLLADTLALLDTAEDPAGDCARRAAHDCARERWRLAVCGEGPLEQDLRERLVALGVADRAELQGFVPAGPELDQMYRHSDFFLHTSLTEGVPQVLFEAFAAGLPVVATDVGAVAATADGAALLIPAGDPQAAADALQRLSREPALRHEMVSAGLRVARACTREAQCTQVVRFLQGTAGALA